MHIAYLTAGLILLTVWLVLFNQRKDLHKEMVTMSLLATPLGLFDFWFVPKYWKPTTLLHLPVGLEGIIYSFCIGGITAVLFAELSQKRLRHVHKWHKVGSLFVLAITVLVFLVLNYGGAPNPMIALYIGLLAGIACTLYLRKDLVRPTLVGALAFGVLYLCLLKLWISMFPDVKTWFMLQGLPKTFIFGVPLWEALFGLIFAAYWGNLYELLFSYSFSPNTKKRPRAARR